MEFNRNVIGKIIKQERQKKGLTQEVLSGLADIQRSHLADIELGNKVPSLKTIWQISSALDLRPHEIIAFAEEESLTNYNDNNETKITKTKKT